MHLGNLAFFLDLGLPLRLAPLYDMLPMLWQPRAGQAEPAPEFAPLPPLPQETDLWPQAAELAVSFWERIASDRSISEAFRAHAATVRALRLRFG